MTNFLLRINYELINKLTSFINKNFKGNNIELLNITSPCNYLSKRELANLYNVTEDKIYLIGGGNVGKTCTIRVKMSDSEYDYLSGSIHFYEELDKTEYGGAWIETWQIQKGTSKSSEWVSNLGKAAFYKGNKRELFETNKIRLDVLKSEQIIGLN